MTSPIWIPKLSDDQQQVWLLPTQGTAQREAPPEVHCWKRGDFGHYQRLSIDTCILEGLGLGRFKLPCLILRRRKRKRKRSCYLGQRWLL